MLRIFKNSKLPIKGLVIGLTAGMGIVNLFSTALAASFSDVENHWSRPFVDRLSEDNVLEGYPDGTFKPEQAVKRAEFAAIIRQAFDREQARRLAIGSVYNDVPSDYWAAPAIEEAYEMGFMAGYSGGVFRPEQEISRVDALVSLMNVLSPPPSYSGLRQNQATPAANQATINQTDQPVRQQPTPRQAKRPLLFSLAMTTLMQPFIELQRASQATPANDPSATATDVPEASTPESETSEAQTTEAQTVQPPRTPPSFVVSDYYQDANSIPQYAISAVAAATQANVVVNYPNPQILNPNQPATRGDIAALVHQIFVRQGKLTPLPEDTEATGYIVDSTAGNVQQ